jgi:hypothetical protein
MSRYHILMGMFIYFEHTRSNLAYAMSVVSQFTHDPRVRDIQVVNRVLQHLKSSLGRRILFYSFMIIVDKRLNYKGM